MKKIISIFFAVLMLLSVLPATVLAADSVAYIEFNSGKGNDANDGLSAATPKKTIGLVNGNGVLSVVKNGGTIVVSQKMYFGDSYTWEAGGPVTLTANYGGRDYKNTSPASNPASGVVKVRTGCKLTVSSDLTFDDIILFSEDTRDTIVVTDGATLTMTESVISMSKGASQFKIVVEKGGKAILNGGIYASVTGLGEIVIGEKATVLSDAPAVASDVAYVNYNKPGSNNNDGLSAETPKQGFGTVDGDGAAGLLKKGGTLVFTGRGYLGDSYTWNVGGDAVFTANYGGVDYKNPEPANNPEGGMFKIKSGRTFTIGSSVTFKDIILFHEGEQCTILVSGGATLTVDESVVTMSNSDRYYNIVVTAGSNAVINGGTFGSVSGDGNIVIGDKAVVLNESVASEEKELIKHEVKTVYLDYIKGNDAADGKSAATAVKGYRNGVFKHMTVGGTVVVSGGSVIGGIKPTNVYELPKLAKTVTFTSVYDGVDYRENSTFLINDDTVFVISSDVVMDNLVIAGNKKESIIRITNNAALTLTDTVEVTMAKENGVPYTIEVEKGAYLIIAKALRDKFNITGEGTVVDYIDGYTEILGKHLGSSTVVELTIGSDVAYINGKANTLDAAPINRNDRTMLPVRFLANTFGIDNDGILWDGATKTATLKNATTTIVITIGAPSMTVNGATVALDSPALIENDRTYLPVRVIANALGVSDDNIYWDGTTSTATLVK